MEKDKIAILEKLLVRLEYGDLREQASKREISALRRALTELIQSSYTKEKSAEQGGGNDFQKYAETKNQEIDVAAEDFDDFLQHRKEKQDD